MRRIEVAAQQSGGSSSSELEERYRQLWTRTSAALAEIDGLIGTLER